MSARRLSSRTLIPNSKYQNSTPISPKNTTSDLSLTGNVSAQKTTSKKASAAPKTRVKKRKNKETLEVQTLPGSLEVISNSKKRQLSKEHLVAQRDGLIHHLNQKNNGKTSSKGPILVQFGFRKLGSVQLPEYSEEQLQTIVNSMVALCITVVPTSTKRIKLNRLIDQVLALTTGYKKTKQFWTKLVHRAIESSSCLEGHFKKKYRTNGKDKDGQPIKRLRHYEMINCEYTADLPKTTVPKTVKLRSNTASEDHIKIVNEFFTTDNFCTDPICNCEKRHLHPKPLSAPSSSLSALETNHTLPVSEIGLCTSPRGSDDKETSHSQLSQLITLTLPNAISASPEASSSVTSATESVVAQNEPSSFSSDVHTKQLSVSDGILPFESSLPIPKTGVSLPFVTARYLIRYLEAGLKCQDPGYKPEDSLFNRIAGTAVLSSLLDLLSKLGWTSFPDESFFTTPSNEAKQ